MGALVEDKFDPDGQDKKRSTGQILWIRGLTRLQTQVGQTCTFLFFLFSFFFLLFTSSFLHPPRLASPPCSFSPPPPSKVLLLNDLFRYYTSSCHCYFELAFVLNDSGLPPSRPFLDPPLLCSSISAPKTRALPRHLYRPPSPLEISLG